MFSRPVRFRFIQFNGKDSAAASFALDSVYIGKSCPNMCSGFGLCSLNKKHIPTCACHEQYQCIMILQFY